MSNELEDFVRSKLNLQYAEREHNQWGTVVSRIEEIVASENPALHEACAALALGLPNRENASAMVQKIAAKIHNRIGKPGKAEAEGLSVCVLETALRFPDFSGASVLIATTTRIGFCQPLNPRGLELYHQCQDNVLRIIQQATSRYKKFAIPGETNATATIGDLQNLANTIVEHLTRERNKSYRQIYWTLKAQAQQPIDFVKLASAFVTPFRGRPWPLWIELDLLNVVVEARFGAEPTWADIRSSSLTPSNFSSVLPNLDQILSHSNRSTSNRIKSMDLALQIALEYIHFKLVRTT